MHTYRLILAIGTIVVAALFILPGLSVGQQSAIALEGRGQVRELFESGSISLNREAFLRRYGPTHPGTVVAEAPDDALQDMVGLIVVRSVLAVVTPVGISMGIAGLVGIAIGLTIPRLPRRPIEHR